MAYLRLAARRDHADALNDLAAALASGTGCLVDKDAAAKLFKRAAERGHSRAAACVEINQCVGCTRQIFTKSFLGDDAAVLARSSGEEFTPPRRRAGVASMAWRTTR